MLLAAADSPKERCSVEYVVLIVMGVLMTAFVALAALFVTLFLGESVLGVVSFGRLSRFLLILFKSLRRNLLRTALTYLATFVLVLVVVMVWSVLYFLDILTSEKTRDLKVIVTEKYQAASQMPFSYAGALRDGAADPRRSLDVRPQDSMTWQFYIGTLDPVKTTREDFVFFIAMEPRKMLTIMDNLFDEFTPGQAQQSKQLRLAQQEALQDVVKEMERNKRAVIIGRERLELMKKKVGDTFTLSGINYPGIDLEFKIIAMFPEGRYNQNAVMNRDYLNDAIDSYPKTHGGVPHALANRSLNMVWLQVSDLQSYSQLSEQIDRSGRFQNPTVKCETLSSGINTWIEGYQDMFWAMRWLLAPAILITMVLVIANAISISVRERRSEMAVLKVLGYRPIQILGLVLGEAMLIGAVSGFLSTTITYLVVNRLPHSQSFQVWVPDSALWWGPFLGAGAAFVGSFLPAWAACRVRVSEVFARTA
jgi:putative ABC transport system permease protein